MLLIKKRLLLRCIHHFKSDLINDLDHMRISDTESSSVMLLQRKWLESWKRMPKVPEQGKAKKGGVISPQNYNLHEFQTRKIWCSQNATYQPKSTVERASSDTLQVVEIKMILLLPCKHHFKSVLNNYDR